MMKRLFGACVVAAFMATSPASADEFGILNPQEADIFELKNQLKRRPELAGILCWKVYEVQKGGHVFADVALDALKDCATVAKNAPSMIMLAHAYENGLGTDVDLEQAAHWMEQAALLDYPMGQYHFGMALKNGAGVSADPLKARIWLMRAAENGNEDATIELESWSGM